METENENKGVNWVQILKVVVQVLTAIVSGIAGGTLVN